jgi:hypothetical protein
MFGAARTTITASTISTTMNRVATSKSDQSPRRRERVWRRIGDSASVEAIFASLQMVRGKAATGEVLGQLSLEVVGEAPAVAGDEALGLLLDAALIRALDGRKNAPKNAAVGAWRRAPRHRPGRAAQVKVSV